jgi:hypothetical protein
MKSMIQGYRHRPGEHCGSTVMRNMLLHHCGLDISEALVFGLGSGIECIYLSSPLMNPEVVIFGRSATLEQDLSEALGMDYLEEPESDDAKAWEDVRREIIEGRPAVICADIFYMDHREYEVHFPFNRFALVGFDDEIAKAYIHDRTNLDPQAVSYHALAASRNPPEYPIFNQWGRFKSGLPRRSLEEACLLALRNTARRMTGADDHQKRLLSGLGEDGSGKALTGLDALKGLREDLPSWREKENPTWIASYVSRTLEVFGTGGGNFRRLYAAFLAEARAMHPDAVDPELPALTERSADLWTAISQSLNRIAKQENEESWDTAVRLIDRIIVLENDIFHSMLEKLPD